MKVLLSIRTTGCECAGTGAISSWVDMMRWVIDRTPPKIKGGGVKGGLLHPQVWCVAGKGNSTVHPGNWLVNPSRPSLSLFSPHLTSPHLTQAGNCAKPRDWTPRRWGKAQKHALFTKLQCKRCSLPCLLDCLKIRSHHPRETLNEERQPAGLLYIDYHCLPSSQAGNRPGTRTVPYPLT